MAQFPVFPEIGSYPGSMNMHFEDGKFMPALDYGPMTGTQDWLEYFVRQAIETTNPSGLPRQYAFVNNKSLYFEDGAITDDLATNQPANPLLDVVGTALIVEGTPFGANGVGTKKLLLGFGSSTLEHNRLRSLTTDTTPWTAANTAATQASFTKAIRVGPDIIAATGSGASGTNIGLCTLGEWMVAKCSAGSDPTLAASYGNVQRVGGPEWSINDMAPLGDSFVVGKGDGAWYWNSRVLRFINVMAQIQYTPHTNNCQFITPGYNCVWIPMQDGRLFAFDGARLNEETPWKAIGPLPRDTYQSRITAIADRGDIVVARTDAFYNPVIGPRASAALGMRAFVISGVGGGTVTEITTNVTDGSLATGYNIGGIAGIGTRATDAIVIGCNQPMEAFIFWVTKNANAAVNALTSPTCSNGSGGWTSLGTIRDGTILKLAGTGFQFVNFPPGFSAGIVSWTNPNSYDLSKTDTFNGVSGLYWYKFSFATTTALTNPTTIDELDGNASRGGLPNTGLLTTTTNFTHRGNAGGLGNLYYGRRQGSKINWQHTYAIDDGGACYSIAWTAARSKTMTNGGNPLLVWSRYQQNVIAESVTRDPSRTPYPKLVQGSTTKPYPRFSARKLVLGDPATRSKLVEIFFEGQYIQSIDQLSCYAWWDNEDSPVLLDNVHGNPGHFAPAPGFNPMGRELNFDIIFSDGAQTEPTAPFVSRVVVEFDQEAQQYEQPRDADFKTPEGP